MKGSRGKVGGTDLWTGSERGTLTEAHDVYGTNALAGTYLLSLCILSLLGPV